jgi:glycosyltransferase involved in cell wall biosynthesis
MLNLCALPAAWGSVRILHTVHAYPPDTGGSEAVVRRLSEGLTERGHEVEVATSAHRDRGDTVDGVPVHGFEASPRGALAYRRWVMDGLADDRWDVVMTYHSKVFTHLALFPFPDELAQRWVYCPTEFTDVTSGSLRHRVYYRTVEPRSLRRAARSVVLTRRDEHRALNLADGIGDHLVRIPNGVDAGWWANGEAGDVHERYELPAEADLAVFAGGLWEHKDVVTLVDALAELEDIHLALAGGDQGHRGAIEERIRKHGLGDRVHLLGRIPREDLRSLYHAADVFASASTNEGFGLVYLEAMACGLPVVAREVGVIPELVDAGAQVLVADDAEGLARSIETLRAGHGEENPSIADRYDWERNVSRFEQLYADVAGEAQR